MQMRYTFASIRSTVDDDTIAALLNSEFARQLTGHEQQLAKCCTISLGCHRQPRDDAFRHDEHVYRRLRVDVLKRDRLIIFPDDFRRNFARDDSLKNGHPSAQFT